MTEQNAAAQPPREALHTRFRTAPTGEMHLGHVIPAYLSMVAAQVSGGTFILRLQTLKAMCCHDRWECYRVYAEKNLRTLMQVGIQPSTGAQLAAHGMHPTWAVQPWEDKDLVDYWYKALGLEAQFGKWAPPEGPKDPHYWKRLFLGNYEQGHEHPYIVLTQVALDMACGRNCLIRGDDHRSGESLAHYFAQQIAMRQHKLTEPDNVFAHVPSFHFIPRVKRSGALLPDNLRQPGGVSLASSAPTTGGYYVKDILEARLQPQALWQFIEENIFTDPVQGREMLHTLPGQTIRRSYAEGQTVQSPPLCITRWGLFQVLKQLKSEIVISDYEWFALLEHGPKLPPEPEVTSTDGEGSSPTNLPDLRRFPLAD